MQTRQTRYLADAPAESSPADVNNRQPRGQPQTPIWHPLPRQALAYGEPFYWDERYNAERYTARTIVLNGITPDDLWPILEMYGGDELAKFDRSLIIGAGDSKLGEQMLSGASTSSRPSTFVRQ